MAQDKLFGTTEFEEIGANVYKLSRKNDTINQTIAMLYDKHC